MLIRMKKRQIDGPLLVAAHENARDNWTNSFFGKAQLCDA